MKVRRGFNTEANAYASTPITPPPHTESAMTSIEIAQRVHDHGVQLFRPRKNEPRQYDSKDFFTGSKRGWVALDAVSASAILAVHKALREDLKPRFEALSPQKQARLAFKFVT
jgi:hypothetical protein